MDAKAPSANLGRVAWLLYAASVLAAIAWCVFGWKQLSAFIGLMRLMGAYRAAADWLGLWPAFLIYAWAFSGAAVFAFRWLRRNPPSNA